MKMSDMRTINLSTAIRYFSGECFKAMGGLQLSGDARNVYFYQALEGIAYKNGYLIDMGAGITPCST